MTNATPLDFPDLAERFSAEVDVELPASKKSGFGSATLRCNGKIFAMCPDGKALVIKLPAERVTELIGTKLAQPYGTTTGKTMKGWALIPPEHRQVWVAFTTEALDYVRGASKPQSAPKRR